MKKKEVHATIHSGSVIKQMVIIMKKNNNIHLESYKSTILEIIEKVIPGCTVYLFGSRARQTNDEGADIDIALDMKQPIASVTLSLIREMLEDSTLPVTVDVVDIQMAQGQFLEEIKKEGIVWKN